MKFLRLLLQSIGFTLFLVCLFVCIRIVFILYIGVIGGHIAEGGGDYFSEILQVLIDGAKYDNRTVAVIVIMYFLLGVIFVFFRSQKVILCIYSGIILFLCIGLNVSNMGFYSIYNDTFDANLFGLFFDDQIAILKTAVSGEYNLIAKIVMVIVVSLVCFYIYLKILAGACFIASTQFSIKFYKPFIFICILVFLGLNIVLINSQFSFQGLSLDQRTKPVKNPFLRNITPGAFRDLYVVYKGYKRIKKSSFSDYSTQTPLEVAKDYFGLPVDTKLPLDLFALLEHVSANNSSVKINHIFYIISESLSEWYFDKDFEEIGLVSGLKSLVDNQHGFKLQNFIENAPNTIASLNVQITGTFETNVPPNAFVGLVAAFPTASGEIFHRLGYKTRFYYGGSGTWSKLDSYTLSQGFDEMFYNSHILSYAKDKNYQKPMENIWGVYDNILFDYIKQNTLDLLEPSFNMVMTTSVHPPHDVDLEHFGVPLDKIQAFLKTKFPHSSTSTNILGHVWWYDKEITRFIKEVSKLLPDSLFIVTGDHYGRTYISPTPDNRAFKSIPLVLYSPLLSPKKLADIGSHIDITPTIVELVAPKGFKYASFGKSIFSNNKTAQFEPNRFALGYYVVGTPRFLYIPDRKVEYINSAKPQNGDEGYSLELYKKLEEARALSWWLLVKGHNIQ